ncbi:hypothetical protein [Arthrobacter sp. UYCu712]|uniref:POT-type proton-dependent oligopeptide transporter n=1 Tax=Arthrobacter sp. UYCu712 TaxID=3156340 RepID=UPI003390C42A
MVARSATPASPTSTWPSTFYMAINAGAVLGPLSTGFAQNQFGFHIGFGLAAVGMFAALVQYSFSKKNLPSGCSMRTSSWLLSPQPL